ncbi:MAG: exodeoxyribonuclease VII large subunit [Oscillospiraceae bacterium]
MEGQIYTVSEVNGFIKNVIDGIPQLSGIYIRGELSNYKIYPSGHHYFTLKDGEGALRCVMFKGSAMKLRFRPENGMQVIAYGRISVFPRDGAYQLYCSQLSPDGVGDLYVAFEQLKDKLYREGLFDEGHKKPLPRYPQRIAIVTSSAGAAIHDMIRILRRRYPIARVLLLPVRVQGVEAPPEIVGAIRYANRWKLADVLITGRGGGSMEDLWAFNDERVARAIYASEIPVISAVGHEPDVTIADFVADRRASTPSNAAEIAVPDMAELLQRLDSFRSRMAQGTLNGLERQERRLKALAEKRVLTDPLAFVQDKRLQLDYVQQKLLTAANAQWQEEQRRFAALAAKLDALSPLKVLGRGYAMARTEDGAVCGRRRRCSPGIPFICGWRRAACAHGNGKGGSVMADKTFEENMTRLEEIVTRLEKGDVPLSQSLSLFEEGTRLAAACRTELDQAEQQVVRLMKGPDGAPVETEFVSEE